MNIRNKLQAIGSMSTTDLYDTLKEVNREHRFAIYDTVHAETSEYRLLARERANSCLRLMAAIDNEFKTRREDAHCVIHKQNKTPTLQSA